MTDTTYNGWTNYATWRVNRVTWRCGNDRTSIFEGYAMIELEIEIDQLTAAMCALEVIPNRTPLQEAALRTLRDAYDNAAEEYWTQIWSY